MYLLNNDRLKDRNPFWTWLFFNKKLKEECKESIPLLVSDMDKLHGVGTRAHEIKDIRSELKILDLEQGMQNLYLECVKVAYRNSRASYHDVLNIVIGLRVLDKILSD